MAKNALKKKEVNEWLNFLEWYKRQPLEWIKANPYPRSCIKCLYLNELHCTIKNVYYSPIAVYWPRECGSWRQKP